MDDAARMRAATASAIGVAKSKKRSSGNPIEGKSTSTTLPATSSMVRNWIPWFFDREDGHDVRMIQRGEGFGFTLETREPVRIGSQRRRDTFSATSRPSFTSVAQ